MAKGSVIAGLVGVIELYGKRFFKAFTSFSKVEKEHLHIATER